MPDSPLHDLFSTLSVNQETIDRSVHLPVRITSGPSAHTDEEHAAFDEHIFSIAPQAGPPPIASTLLWFLLMNSGGKLKTLSPPEARDFLAQYPYLQEELEQGWRQGSFKAVRELEILRPIPEANVAEDYFSVKNQSEATELSWEADYVGNAVDGLTCHIKKYFKRRIEGSSKPTYAHYTSIVQSSGMGKSRLVDEFAKSHFVIRMNLRGKGSTGYPPADSELRDFLVQRTNRMGSYHRSYTFLIALFEVTRDEVLDLKGGLQDRPDLSPELEEMRLAASFRERMTSGQKMIEPSSLRKSFFARVIEKAKQLLGMPGVIQEIGDPGTVTPERGPHKDRLVKAVQDLQDTLKPPEPAAPTSAIRRSLRNQTQPANEMDSFPTIFLEFDEAHLLTSLDTLEGETGYTHFSELRRALRMIHLQPVFSIFLSTTGKISQFTPSRAVDPSARLMEARLFLIPPYTALGFDQAMIGREARDGTHSIDKVAEAGFMAHLGRPLFGTRYDAALNDTVRDDILRFAQLKLINCDPSAVAANGLELSQRLAVLSVRLALEFNSTTFAGRNEEQKQVEGHLRICLKVDKGFESMKTVSPSEPLVAEAAAKFMYEEYSFDAPETLKHVLEGFSINQGDRGELLVLLLMCLSRDATITEGCGMKPVSRVMSVSDFMSNLFRDLNQGAFKPSVLAEGTNPISFRTTFGNTWAYFNHFIKVHEQKVITRRYLTALIVRGAAVLCANGQRGIDVVIPYLYNDKTIQQASLGAIIIQVKNDPSYTQDPDQDLFDRMDPYNLGLFDEESPPVPIIRIVFALASPVAGYTQIRRKPRAASSRFTSYDIWSAGLSAEHLAPIKESNEATWGALLQASRPWEKIYTEDCSPVESALMRSEDVGSAIHEAHWKNFFVMNSN